MHLVMGVGRPAAIVQTAAGVSMEAIDHSNFFSAPVIDGGIAYVPLRYVMEKAGYIVEFESSTGTTVFKPGTGSTFPVWIGMTGRESRNTKLDATQVDFKDGVFTVSIQGSGDKRAIEASPTKNYFGRAYIPARELERFELLIHWDEFYNTVHIMRKTTTDFDHIYDQIIGERDAEKSIERTGIYFRRSIRADGQFAEAFDRYVSIGADFGNYANGSLALNIPEGLFLSTVRDGRRNESSPVVTGSRYLNFTTANNQKYIYFVQNSDGQLYKSEVTGSLRIGEPSKVSLPQALSGKKISQLVINHDRLFFVAYDEAADGGHIYMARVGNEAETAVRVTRDRAWNIGVTPHNRLYYTNFERNYELYVINLTNVANLTAMYDNPQAGLAGTSRQSGNIQSFTISKRNPDTYYYSDSVTGAIMEGIVDGTVRNRQLVRPENNRTLFNSLNLYDAGRFNILYYIEYPNGRRNDFSEARIMAYDIGSNETREIHASDEKIMGLTIVDGTMYFTNGDYSKLFRIDNMTSRNPVVVEL